MITETDALEVNATIGTTNISVAGYDGGIIPVVGEAELSVQFNAISTVHKFIVVKGSKNNLLGRDLFSKFSIDIVFNRKSVSHVSSSVLDEFSDYLSDDFQSSVTEPVHIDIVENAKPIFSKARQIPIRLRGAVKNEIQRLANSGILSKVYSSDWASPIVVAYKKDGNLRICADFSATVNKFLSPVNSPLITIDEAILSIGDAKIFPS